MDGPPRDFAPRVRSRATGNEIHIHGLSNGQGLAIAAVAGLALGFALWALSYADKARMEARILQVKVEGFENALHARGIDPNPHLKGEPQ